MKGKISKLANLGLVKTAVITGTFNGKPIELGVTTTNTTWRTIFGSTKPVKGADIEVEDDLIQEGVNPATNIKTGRWFISRVDVDKFEAAARMAIAEQQLTNAGF